MKINRENWGAFVIDYYDENLSALQQKELFLFLTEHPDLQDDFENYQTITVASKPISFAEKQMLKKREITPYGTINENSYEKFLVLFIDDELSDEEQTFFTEFLKKNPFLKTEINRLQKTILTADANIVFAGKEVLKKRAVVPLILQWAAIAALLVIGLLLIKPSVFNNKKSILHPQSIAINKMLSQCVSIDLIADNTLRMQLNQVVNKPNSHQLLVSNPIKRRAPIGPMDKINREFALLTEKNSGNLIASIQPFTPPPDVLVIVNRKSGSKNPFLKILFKPFKEISKLLAQKQRARKEKNLQETPAVKIFDTGITAFNALTGSDVVIAKVFNGKGTLIGYHILGNNWQINRKVNPNRGTE